MTNDFENLGIKKYVVRSKMMVEKISLSILETNGGEQTTSRISHVQSMARVGSIGVQRVTKSVSDSTAERRRLSTHQLQRYIQEQKKPRSGLLIDRKYPERVSLEIARNLSTSVEGCL
jgi:hypothetical protein